MIKKLLAFLIPFLFISSACGELPSTLTDREYRKFRESSDGGVAINAVLAPGSTINTTGNITGAFIYGNGTYLTGVNGTGGNATANDTAYGSSWNGSTTQIPSQNAVYDKIETLQPLEATLTDIADGTITENLVNTANPWAADEIVSTVIHEGESAASLTAINGSNISSGTVADARIAATLLRTTGTGIELTALNGTNITSGTVADARIAATLLRTTGSAASLTAINASNISTGTLPMARLQVSGVSAGSYGNGTHVPAITLDTYGRVTAVTNTSITASGASYNQSLNTTDNVTFKNINATGTLTASNVSLNNNQSAIVFAPNDYIIRGDTVAGAIEFNNSNVQISDGSLTVVGGQFIGDGGGMTNVTGSSQWDDGVGTAIGYVGGNVGIGTTNPTNILSIVTTGEAAISLNSDSEAFLKLYANDYVGFSFYYQNTTWIGEGGGDASNGDIYFSSSSGRVRLANVTNFAPRTTIPASPEKGDLYMNDTNNITYIYNGTSWKALY